MKKVLIIGGGISGLSTAYYLEQLREKVGVEVSVELWERNEHLGGVVRTESIEDHLLEAGPEGWASYKFAGKSLVRELGLEEDLIGSNDEIRKTLIVRNGDLKSLPDGMMFLAPIEPLAFWRTAPLSFTGKLRASLEPLIPRSRTDLSIEQFFSRRLGKEFTETLVEPLISGVFGADFRTLSAPSSLPELHRAEQKKGSLWRGLRRFAKMDRKISVLVTMKKGMQQLTDTLAGHLSTRLHTGVSVQKVKKKGHEYTVTTEDGREGSFDRVVFCTPAHATAQILQSLLPKASEVLRSIPYGSSRVVYLGYPKSSFEHPLDGFGFIVPRKEDFLIDACTWVTSKFDYRAPEDRVLLRCAVHSDLAAPEEPRDTPLPGELADDPLIENVTREVSRVLKISAEPDFAHTYRNDRALPRMVVGHGRRMKELRELLSSESGIVLAGSYLGGVGIPDCIVTGKEAAGRVLETAREPLH